MFWGLIMEPGKKYSQTVEKSFHVSHAALDLTTAQNDPVQVLLGFDDRNYLICTLQKGRTVQAPLDLNFQGGDKISFATNGPGHVHLTGYLVPEDDFMNMEEENEEEAEDEEAPELITAVKRKLSEMNKKEQSKANKKSKKEEPTIFNLNEMEDTDDSDDSDVNMSDLLEGKDDDEEEEDESDDEEADEEDDDDDDDDDDDGEESEEEVKVEKTPKKNVPSQNGIMKQGKGSQNKDATPGAKQAAKTPKGDQTPKTDKTPKADKTPKGQKSPGNEKGTPQKRTIEGGVVVEELKVGDGAIVKPGKMVQVYYEGRLKSNNKMFDSSTKGMGFRFRIGKQEVIKGWDVGLLGMKVGGKRRIVCPPNMAYGAQGSPPVIPPNSTLIFEVELKNVK